MLSEHFISMPRVVVATHGHCFDGLCSAVMFTRLLRHLHPGKELTFKYRAMGYGPGQTTGNHPADGGARGKGPKGYKRSDDRIAEDVNDSLTQDTNVDATDIAVVVKDGEVTLNGTVTSRIEKRGAEDLAHDVSGVTHVQNNLRIVAASNSRGTT